MSPDTLAQYLALITPVAVGTAIASGIAFALVIRALRPDADARLITYLTIVLSALWYLPQWAALFFTEGTGWGTLGRWSLFIVGFVVPMHVTLRWRSRS